MRQKPIGDYIVDFYCSKLKLVIEIDGESHDGRFSYDMQRQSFLESIGLIVLRFNDIDVKRDISNVLTGCLKTLFMSFPKFLSGIQLL